MVHNCKKESACYWCQSMAEKYGDGFYSPDRKLTFSEINWAVAELPSWRMIREFNDGAEYALKRIEND